VGMVEALGYSSTDGVARVYASIEVGEDSGAGIVYSTAVLYEPSFRKPASAAANRSRFKRLPLRRARARQAFETPRAAACVRWSGRQCSGPVLRSKPDHDSGCPD
jgi:hypothetical protein